jgi:hypothetical protein
MAATKIDPQVAKEAKQKKLLIIMSVVLVGLMAWQLPKLMGGSSTPAATPTTPTTVPAAGTPVAGTTPTGVAPTAPADLRSAAAGAKPKAGEAQLASFSLFRAKDPFVQKIIDKSAEPVKAAVVGKAANGGGAASGGVSGPAAKPPAIVYGFATLSLNGEEEPVVAKGQFPADEPMFQVVAIGKNQIKIGIAGGKLENGKAAVIKLGKSLTFVNDATGARYVIQLLYTGAEPEPTTTFTTPGTADPSLSGSTTTPPTTTTAP